MTQKMTEKSIKAQIKPPKVGRYFFNIRNKQNQSSLPIITSNNTINSETSSGLSHVRLSKLEPITPSIAPQIMNAPIKPEEAVERFKDQLTKFEMTEIMKFPDIYYIGIINKKIHPKNIKRSHNYGFDNENHQLILHTGDHLAYRFQVLEIFGSGSFGQVVRCFDHKRKDTVAVKVIVNTQQMHEQGKVEAKILAQLNKARVENVVKAFDFFIFRSHICITFEALNMNLYELIHKTGHRGLSLKHVKLYIVQILTGLNEVHKRNIIHCDLKPDNILLTHEKIPICKIVDFGSGCFVGKQMYNYIQSRYYRAPEVIIGIKYDTGIDMWSLGCIIGELITGKPLFPGETELEILWMMAEIMGSPPIDLVQQGKRRKQFFDGSFSLLPTVRQKKVSSRTLEDVLNCNDSTLIDFISRCLTWYSSERISTEEALHHPWINNHIPNLFNSLSSLSQTG